MFNVWELRLGCPGMSSDVGCYVTVVFLAAIAVRCDEALEGEKLKQAILATRPFLTNAAS